MEGERREGRQTKGGGREVYKVYNVHVHVREKG